MSRVLMFDNGTPAPLQFHRMRKEIDKYNVFKRNYRSVYNFRMATQFCAPTYLEDGLEFGASSESNNLLLIRHFHVLQNVYQRTSYHAGQLSNLKQIETLLYLCNSRYIPIKYNIHGHHRHVLALAIEGQHEFCSTFRRHVPNWDSQSMIRNLWLPTLVDSVYYFFNETNI